MKLAKHLTNKMCNDNVISLEEAEIVEYGLENIGGNLLGLFVTTFIGGCFGHLTAGFVLWLLLFPLRKNAGGFHAETKTRCLLLSVGIVLLSFPCFFQIAWAKVVYIVLDLLFFGIIFVMAPVGNHNKILDMQENKVYRRRTRIILISEEILFVLALIFKWKELWIVITMVFFIVGILLLTGKIKLRLQ